MCIHSTLINIHTYQRRGSNQAPIDVSSSSAAARLVNEFLYGDETASRRPLSCPHHQACWELNGCGPRNTGQLPLATSVARTDCIDKIKPLPPSPSPSNPRTSFHAVSLFGVTAFSSPICLLLISFLALCFFSSLPPHCVFIAFFSIIGFP